MKKWRDSELREILSFVFVENGFNTIAVLVSLGLLPIGINTDSLIIIKISAVLIAAFILYKIGVCYDKENEINRLEYEIEELEKKLTFFQDYSSEQTNKIIKLEKEIAEADDRILKLLGIHDSQEEEEEEEEEEYYL